MRLSVFGIIMYNVDFFKNVVIIKVLQYTISCHHTYLGSNPGHTATGISKLLQL